MNTNQSFGNVQPSGEFTTDDAPILYVIQRSSETVREWWTGYEWSNDFNQARQYDYEPDACVEAEDEMAVAIKREDVDD